VDFLQFIIGTSLTQQFTIYQSLCLSQYYKSTENGEIPVPYCNVEVMDGGREA
jgi:hypothetical protein